MLNNAKGKGKSKDEILDLVKTKIMKEIMDATQNGTLPGIVLENSNSQTVSIKNIGTLNHMVMILSQKMKAKRFDRFSLCYFINYLITSLGLTEEDFEEFHRKIRKAKGEDEDEDEDEDGD